MFCPQCGTQNNDGARFCLSCGTAFPMGEAAGSPTPVPIAATATPAAAMPYPAIRYAGFWMRFVAWILDAVALGIVRMVIRMVLPDFAGWALVLCAGWLYFALLESSEMQATVGKMALGLFVTDMEGRRITFGKASGRFFGKLLSTLMLGIGYLLAAFTEKKQALHDLIAGCLVMRR